MPRIACRGVALVILLVGARARAAGGCQILNVTPTSFGSYTSGSSSPLDSVGEIDVSCAAQSAVQISMGRGASARQNPRQMRSGGQTLAYNLFLDAAHTAVWGDGAEGTQTFMGIVRAGQTLRLPIFGRIFPLQAVQAGFYSDRIIVSVVF